MWCIMVGPRYNGAMSIKGIAYTKNVVPTSEASHVQRNWLPRAADGSVTIRFSCGTVINLGRKDHLKAVVNIGRSIVYTV
jgi:hypothetical protein